MDITRLPSVSPCPSIFLPLSFFILSSFPHLSMRNLGNVCGCVLGMRIFVVESRCLP